MDPLTHMLAGAAAADCVRPKNGMPAAALPFAMVVAALPDIDVLPAFVAAFPRNPFSRQGLFDQEVMRAMHRGYTHAVPVLVLAGFLLAWMGWRASGRAGGYGGWLRVVLAALTSHVLLDLANGPVRLLLPLAGGWYGWGQAREADPVVFGVLLACVLANHPPRFRRGRRFTSLRLIESLAVRLHRRARRVLTARATAIAAVCGVAIYLACRIVWAGALS